MHSYSQAYSRSVLFNFRLKFISYSHLEALTTCHSTLDRHHAYCPADLVSNRIAHVIVVSDNRESAKLLAKALPTEPLNTVALADADPASSLAFINKKVQEASVEYNISPEETQLIERLDGRASDLETIIHQVGFPQQPIQLLVRRAIPKQYKF
ncbi:hypothetical protein JB92DRAFT_768002 [Gautieria morchelliformis]|nr:hypothetical protein JB92DRAFT_768002 [Gautieria morchelliformis]